MPTGIELYTPAGVKFFSTESQTWNYIGSFVVPSGVSQTIVREPPSGAYAPSIPYGYCEWVAYSTDNTLGGIFSSDIFWGGTYMGTATGPATSVALNGWTYYLDPDFSPIGWQWDEFNGIYYCGFGVYRTGIQSTFTPQSVTQNFPTLSLMSEVIFQRSAVDNPPDNQEGYIHSVSQSGNNVTGSGGNIRTLVTVLGR